jgi:hypothetical protein
MATVVAGTAFRVAMATIAGDVEIATNRIDRALLRHDRIA